MWQAEARGWRIPGFLFYCVTWSQSKQVLWPGFLFEYHSSMLHLVAKSPIKSNFNWRSFHSTHRKSWFFDIRCVDVLGRLEIFQKIKSPCVLCELWMYPNSWRCTTCMRQCFQPKSGKFEVRPFKKCQDNYYQILFIYVDRVKKGRWWLSMWNSLLQVLLRTPLPRSVL